MSKVEARLNYLFVIGIDNYKEENYTNLNNSIYDCKELIKELTENYNFKLIEEPLYNELATRRNILDKLNSLQYLTMKEDNLIIYYAGHGQMNQHNNKGSWVPYDANNSSSDYIPNLLIKDIIEDIEAKHVFLISDSCFSGTFLTNTRGADNDKVFYNKLDNKKSRWYLASGSTEKVSDGIKGEGSPFSNALLSCLRDNSSPNISVSEIINIVRKKVGNNAFQQPIGGEIQNVGHDWGEMVLVKATNNKETNVSEEWISRENFNALMRTYGFYLGQKRKLDIIEQKFPNLKNEIFIVKAEWDVTFGSSVESIIDKVKKLSGDKWDESNNIIFENLDNHFNLEVIDSESAYGFILEIYSRIRGNIASPILETLLSYKPEFRANPIEEFSRNFRKKLESKSHPKSKGLNFDIEIPLSWTINDGKRPNVLWLTNNQEKSILTTFTIKLNKTLVDLEIPSDGWTEELLNESADLQLDCKTILNASTSGKATNRNCKRSFFDGCHGMILDFEDEITRSETIIEFYCRTYIVLYNEFNLIISFQVHKSNIDLLKEKEKYALFFNSIMNSLIILNKYE